MWLGVLSKNTKTMFTYFLQVNLCWLLFYGLYYVLLSRETFFNLNRIYLIISLLAGLALPFAANWLQTETPLAIPLDSILLPTFVVGIKGQVQEMILPLNASNTEGGYAWNWWTVISTLYFIGVGVMSLRFFHGLFSLFLTFKTANFDKKDGVFVAYTEGVSQPFSFFNFIFINNKALQDIDFQNIMQHEKAHAKQGHSFDVVFLELLNIVFWCSPFIYLYKNSLRIVHEYLADAAVLRSVPKKQYGILLIQQSQTGRALALANPFFSQLKKRIIMMTRNPSKRRALGKYVFALPIFLLLVSFLATPNNAAMTATENMSNKVISKISDSKEPLKKRVEVGTVLENQALMSETTVSMEEKPIVCLPIGSRKPIIGGEIAKGIFQSIDGLMLHNNTSRQYRISQFQVYKIAPSGIVSKVLFNDGNVLQGTARDLVEKADYGDEFYFKDILVSKNFSKDLENFGTLHFSVGDYSRNPDFIDNAFKVTLAGFENGAIDMALVKQQTQFRLIQPAQKTCDVQSFDAYKTSETGEMTETIHNTGSAFKAPILKLLKSVEDGDKLFFENIKTRCPNDVNAQDYPSMAFNIKGKNTSKSLKSDVEKAGLYADLKKYDIDGGSIKGSYGILSPERAYLYPRGPSSIGAWGKNLSDTTQPLTIVEELPHFVGGQDSMFRWIGRNILYPTTAREKQVEGTVYVGFVVETDGRISEVKVKREPFYPKDTLKMNDINGMQGFKLITSPAEGSLGRETVRMVKAMPKWAPGRDKGKFVRVAYTLPIKFKLE
jgi:hypothetical protein